MSGDRVLAPFERRAVPVTAREEHGAYVVLRVRDAAGPAPTAGQFYMLATAERWGGGEDGRPFLPRAFSVLRHARGELHFLLEDVGPGTNRLCAVEPGQRLLILGPLGRGFHPPQAGSAILVGGGVGIAPLAILQDRLAENLDAQVLLGFRDSAHAAGAALLHEATVATDDGSVGHHGLVTDLLDEQLRGCEATPPVVFACGPPPMLEAVRARCAQSGVAAQLALEAGMACGYGACFGCAVSTRQGLIRLCLEGPVLEAQTLEAVTAH